MKQLFWYTRKTPVAKNETTGELIFKEYKDAFSVEHVLRVSEMEDGTMLVLLNDIHNRISEMPIKNKRDEVIGTKNQTLTVQSEIVLEKIDAERFIKVTS